MSLDTQPWIEEGNAIRLTQDKWIQKYNDAGRIMASAPDFYAALKEEEEELLSSLRADFGNWLALSTRLQYNSDNLEGKIIHYHNSNVIEPIETQLVIPVFRDTPIEEAIQTGSKAEEGLFYLQTYFGTQDSPEEIIQLLEKVSGKSKDKIKIWTADIKGTYTRQSHPERAAFVGFDNDDFSVNGNFNLSNYGRSRGVSAGGAWSAAEPRVEEKSFPYAIESGISRKPRSVHFSNIQQIGEFEKYTGMFCFDDGRYVVSLLRRNGMNMKISDAKVAQVLSGKGTTEEKAGLLGRFNPTYVHIAKYHEGNLVDDSEGFKSLKD